MKNFFQNLLSTLKMVKGFGFTADSMSMETIDKMLDGLVKLIVEFVIIPVICKEGKGSLSVTDDLGFATILLSSLFTQPPVRAYLANKDRVFSVVRKAVDSKCDEFNVSLDCRDFANDTMITLVFGVNIGVKADDKPEKLIG